MTNIPITIQGLPLTELIGKEVTVKLLNGQVPFTKTIPERLGKRLLEVLWDIEFNPIKNDYKLHVLIIFSDNSKTSYTCYFSNVKVHAVESGKAVDLTDLEDLLRTLNKMNI